MTRMRHFDVLCLLALPSIAHGQYSPTDACQLDQMPIALLSRDPVTGNFTVVKRLAASEKNLSDGDFRMLEVEDIHSGNVRSSIVPGIRPEEVDSDSDFRFLPEQNVLDGDGNSTRNELFYARECSCHEPHSPTVYCPFSIDTCLRPRGSNEIPGCRNLPKAYDVKRYSFLIFVLWYGSFMLCLCYTKLGTSVTSYLLSFCIPGFNNYMAGRMLRRNPEYARDLIRSFVLRQQRILEEIMENARTEGNNNEQGETTPNAARAEVVEPEEPVKPPTSLVLRTKIYHAETKGAALEGEDVAASVVSMEEDDDETNCCTICFAPLVDGERVGQLPCEHLFHVECLKMWLQRKNVCPLCQTKEVATPRYDDLPSETEEATEQDNGAGGSEELVQVDTPRLSAGHPEATVAATEGQDSIEDAAEQNNNPQSCIPIR